MSNFSSFNIYFNAINALCRAIILPRHQIIFKEITEMSGEALEGFMTEPANGLGINLKQVCNGDLISREAGSAGGSMVNVMCLVQQ